MACHFRLVMNANTEEAGSALDTVKLVVVIALLAGGVYGFYSFADQALWVRLIGLLAVIGVAVFVALQTAMGRRSGNLPRIHAPRYARSSGRLARRHCKPC